MDVPIHTKICIAERKVDGMTVLRGPMQASDMRLGMNLPGRLAAFIAMSRLTESAGERWRTAWPNVAIFKGKFQLAVHQAERGDGAMLLT